MVRPANFSYGDLQIAISGSTAVVVSQMIGRQAWKTPASVATTGDVDITADLVAGSTIDGVTLVLDMRVLVWQNTDASENGVRIVPASGTAPRAPDFDSSDEIVGARVPITSGTLHSGKVFRNTNTTTIVVDTDPITFVVDSVGGGGIDTVGADAGDALIFDGTRFVVRASGRHLHIVGEPFVGDASQTVFYLAHEAELDTVAAYDKDGHRVSITQNTTETDKITFGAAPAAGTGWFDYLADLI